MEKIKVLSLDRIMELFEEIPDPRRPRGNIRHKLTDLLVIILLGIICGCETWIEIEDYAHAKYEWLKTFLELPGGVPSNDTYRRLMARMLPQELENAYRQWVLPYVGGCIGKQIAIDGKTICAASKYRVSNKETPEGKLHIVSAWVREDGPLGYHGHAGHLHASWAGGCRGGNETAGRSRTGKAGAGEAESA